MRLHAFVVVLLLVVLALPVASQTFGNPVLIPSTFDPTGIATGDFNHDGNPDIVYVDGLGQGAFVLHVLLGHGDGTFTRGQDIVLPVGVCNFTCRINVADISADGNLDLVMGGGTGQTGIIAALLGNSDGTFQQPVVSTLASNNAFPNFAGVFGLGFDGVRSRWRPQRRRCRRSDNP